MRLGTVAGIAAFVCWGLVPVYWKLLGHVGSLELMAQRTVWSLVFLLAVLGWQGRLRLVAAALRSRRTLGLNFASGALLMGNWLAFLWAVNHAHVLEASLGYFLVPVFHVAAGYLVCHERPRPLQWLAIVLAAVGVVFLLLGVGQVPWLALTIVGTWGSYSLVRKKSPMGALDGLTVETLLFTPLAAGYLVWLALLDQGSFGRGSLAEHGLVIGSGPVTAVPLVWFAYAALRIRLTTLGLLQYIAPSVQFVLGWSVYLEPFDAWRFLAYALIWLGLACYSADGLCGQARRHPTGGSPRAGA